MKRGAVAALERSPEDQDDPKEDHQLGEREAAPGRAGALVERRPAGTRARARPNLLVASTLLPRGVALGARRVTALAAPPTHFRWLTDSPS